MSLIRSKLRIRLLKIIAFSTLVFLLSCKKNENKNSHNKALVLTNSTDTSGFEVESYINENRTFGYAVFINKVKIIDQPTIPGIAGNKGFSSKEKATLAGKFVAGKILKKQFPPTVTIRELDSLKVLD